MRVSFRFHRTYGPVPFVGASRVCCHGHADPARLCTRCRLLGRRLVVRTAARGGAQPVPLPWPDGPSVQPTTAEPVHNRRPPLL
jgi:hypothetical protein